MHSGMEPRHGIIIPKDHSFRPNFQISPSPITPIHPAPSQTSPSHPNLQSFPLLPFNKFHIHHHHPPPPSPKPSPHNKNTISSCTYLPTPPNNSSPLPPQTPASAPPSILCTALHSTTALKLFNAKSWCTVMVFARAAGYLA